MSDPGAVIETGDVVEFASDGSFESALESEVSGGGGGNVLQRALGGCGLLEFGVQGGGFDTPTMQAA